MTTILFTVDSVAYDSQMTSGHVAGRCGSEKVQVLKGMLFGVAGDADCGERVPHWFVAGANQKKVPVGEWEMTVVMQTSVGPLIRRVTSEQPSGFFIEFPAAIGSGGNFALAAHLAGADAGQAVVIAAQLDILTGGDIKMIKYDDVLTVKKTLPGMRNATRRTKPRKKPARAVKRKRTK